MYRFLLLFHIISSSVFVIVAIVLTVRSISGWTKNLKYSNTDKYLSFIFMALLYFTLLHGIIMYFFVDPSLKSTMDIQVAMRRAALRFWVVEHFYFMTFALILAQIGRIFIRKTVVDKNRFIYSTFYFGIATLITISSLVFYFMYR